MGADDKANTGFLWELPGARERLQIVQADLLEDGSFDMAVHGVHTVFHAAAPTALTTDGDPKVNNKTLLSFSILLKTCPYSSLKN